MKHIILSLSLFLFVGCSSIQTSEYDSHEYTGFINIMTQSEKLHEACSVADREHLLIAGSRLETSAHNLENYTSHRPNNFDTTKIVKIIRENVKEFVNRYQQEEPSSVYCEAKTQNIIDQSKIGANAVQQKVRR